MRIGIDVRLWNETGVGRYIRNLVQELLLIDQQNEYILFCLEKDLERVKSFGIVHDRKRWKVIATNIHWHSIKEQVLFPKILNKENLDLMHFPYFSVPIFYTKPFVITIHDLIPYHYPTGKASTLPGPLYEFKNQMYRIVIHAAAARAAQIIVPLRATKEDVVKTLAVSEKKVHVTYEGVDEQLQKQAEVSERIKKVSGKQKYFLYVGNAYPHKNIERMINAFIQFNVKEKDARLLLVGKEDYFYKKIQREVSDIDGIIFLHEVSDNELSYLYGHASALIAPSLLEGFGLTTLEAMANNCLVVASDIPAFHEVCAEAAEYFASLDEKALLSNLLAVYNLNSEEKVKRLIIGKKRVALFSWKEMAVQTKAIYESSISIRPGK